MKLTKAQRAQLDRLNTLSMPASLQALGWPGFPQRMVDLRVMGSLERAGYVEAGVHVYRLPSDDRDTRGIWWRITDAGRAALSNSTEEA